MFVGVIREAEEGDFMVMLGDEFLLDLVEARGAGILDWLVESPSDEFAGEFEACMSGGLVEDGVCDWRLFRDVGSTMELGWELLACGGCSGWAGNSGVGWVGLEGVLIGV